MAFTMCIAVLRKRILELSKSIVSHDMFSNFGQTIPEMDLFSITHKEVYRRIHNYLAGRFIGATRERALLDEVIKCLFCKVYLIRQGHEGVSNKEDVSKLYRDTFRKLKVDLEGVFSSDDKIQLDALSLEFFDSEINSVDLLNSKRDPFGDLYEVFIGTGVREEEGQFFTPKNGVDLLVSIVDPKPGEKIIDPACGAGGFLTNSINHLMTKGTNIKELKNRVYGIDKDDYLAKLAKTHVALLTLSTGFTFSGDSLAWMDKNNIKLDVDEGEFDVVLTNPPFGKNIVATSKEVQKDFDLGYEWKHDKKSNRYVKSTKLQKSVPPQVMFVERCIKLLRVGGRLGIVLPESLLTSASYSYVIQYIHDHCNLIAVLGMPEDFFKTSGKGGTHTKVCLVIMKRRDKTIAKRSDDTFFLAEAKWCGNDSRGREIENDDLPIIKDNYLKYCQNKLDVESLLGYAITRSRLKENILSPRYYNPEINSLINSLQLTHDVLTMGKLLLDGVIEVKTGDEVGKLAYGTGHIPFVRTSDISSWEVKLDPKHGVSEEIFEKYRYKQDVQPNDILMVKDGTYLIGTCAILTQYDKNIIYQSHLYKIRVLKPEIMSPYLLLAILSSKPIKEQIRSKRFTQDIIDSLGNRLYELELPIPRDSTIMKQISDTVKTVIEERIHARELARKACLDVIAV